MKSQAEKRWLQKQERQRRAWLFGMGVAACVVLTAAAWAHGPRMTGDFWIALAGGRDAAAGELNTPDDWAFTTRGAVWINQNWLTDLLLYGIWRATGPWGELALKAGLLVATAAFTALAARSRIASWPVSLLIAGAVLAGSRAYLELRPNLVSLLLTPLLLWLLYLTRRRVHVVWAAAAVVGLWANCHGGFVFGLGVMALWAGCELVGAARREGLGAAARRCWPLAGATVAAALPAAFANPFGAVNLVHPFTVAGGERWRRINEWRSVFSGGTDYGSRWEFFVLLGVLAVLVGWWWDRRRRIRRKPGRTVAPLFAPAFDVLLAAGVIAMACMARRFIPLAAVALVPLLAGLLERLIDVEKYRWPVVGLAVVLVAPVVYYSGSIVRPYLPDNPVYPPQSLFARMHGMERFPTGAAEFLRANGLGGRLLHPWEWEGYLRWVLDGRVELLAGGRAQQVYPIDAVQLYERLRLAPDPAAALTEHDVRVAVVPMDAEYEPWTARLLGAPNGRWAQVYSDGRAAVLVDAAAHEAMIEKVAAGRAAFETDATAALSKAMCLASPSRKTPIGEIVTALQEAAARQPTVTAYATLGNLLLADRVEAGAVAPYLAGEEARLRKMDTNGANGLEILQCRRTIARVLAEAYRRLGRPTEATAQQRTVEQFDAQIEGMLSRWR